ncbi:cytochrome P450 [Camillea tinctor]|nr:cytochrome P450 [Camillea tinctor]
MGRMAHSSTYQLFNRNLTHPLSVYQDIFEHNWFLKLTFLAVVLSFLYLLYPNNEGSSQSLPVANRLFSFEPRLFSRIRWAIKSKQILDNAHNKFKGLPYLLDRGDADIVILPSHFLPELNRLSIDMMNSREFHSFTLLGHLTGLDVVRKTSYHVKILLSRISPALPELLRPAAQRISASVERTFPRDTENWASVEPLDLVVRCVSEIVALALYGPPACDDPWLVRFCSEHTKNLFTIVFIMRWVPPFLQPALVWLLPAKWRLDSGWKALEKSIVPLVNRKKEELEVHTRATSPDLISWMVKDGKSTLERDPYMLTRLAGTLTAGGTYSTANFVVGVLSDLVANPHLLEEIREEIREVHEKASGNWDSAAFNNLEKLDSVMKETSRLNPSSWLSYGRVMDNDYTLSNGLTLHKNQVIAIVSHIRSMDPDRFKDPQTFKGLRFYEEDLQHHRAQPFRSLDSEIMTWGSGRWACPGRFFANTVSKIILVKLLNEYDFKFVDGKRPPNAMMHEFVLFYPYNKLLVRRRAQSLNIEF